MCGLSGGTGQQAVVAAHPMLIHQPLLASLSSTSSRLKVVSRSTCLPADDPGCEDFDATDAWLVAKGSASGIEGDQPGDCLGGQEL